MDVRFMLFSRWNEYLGRLEHPKEATHYQEIDGEDTLHLVGDWLLAKGDRIVWTDGAQWFEHVVDEISQEHSGGETFSYECMSSLQWDWAYAHVRSFTCSGVSADYVVGELCALTAWSKGTVNVSGTNSFQFEQESAYQALCEVVGAFGVEFQPEIDVGPAGVTARRVNVKARIGSTKAVRFTYGRGMTAVRKNVLPEGVYTAVYAYGGTPESSSTSTPERIWTYQVNSSALDMWGISDGRGGKAQAVGMLDDYDITDMSALVQAAQQFLQEHSAPSISYETDMPFLALKGVHLGDEVQVIDRDFTPELRLETRIGALQRDLITGETSTATFGTVTALLPDALARSYSAMELTRRQVTNALTAAETANNNVSALGASVTTQQVVITDGTTSGTLTINSSGELLFNGEKIGGTT